MSCNRVFATGDTHLGHKKLAEVRGFVSVEEHDRAIVERWNATVRAKDTVWHLGDVFFGGRDNHAILSSLNGLKRLILGNHDAYPLAVYQQYFSRIYGAAEYRHCILTHIPVNPNQFDRYERNVHGHMHSRKIDDPRYICVSLEHFDLRPVLFDTLLECPSLETRSEGIEE